MTRWLVLIVAASLLLALAVLYLPMGTSDESLVDTHRAASSPVAGQPKVPERKDQNSRKQDVPIANNIAPASGVREVQMDANAGFLEAMAAIGLEDMERRYAEWLLSRGFPYSDQTGTYLLDQPYMEYDDDTLRAFAENNDMWAQQFLAERLETTRPAEALDWYRKAAINGSINAMNRMISMYSRLGVARADDPGQTDEYKQQMYAIRDGANSVQEMSFAWAVAAQLAGGDPSQNRALSDRIGGRFDEASRDRACQMAQSLYDDLGNARAARGLGDFNRQPPPFMLGSADALSTPPCPNLPPAPTLDLTSCEEINVVTNGVGSAVIVCHGAGG